LLLPQGIFVIPALSFFLRQGRLDRSVLPRSEVNERTAAIGGTSYQLLFLHYEQYVHKHHLHDCVVFCD
jgi:hypothetical protein